MKNAVLGVLVACGVISALVFVGSPPTKVFGSPAGAGPASSHGLMAVGCIATDKGQQLTVLDPETKVMGVYQVDTASGEIVLKSVRNIYWDLQMVEFNTTNPSPAEIRSLLERK